MQFTTVGLGTWNIEKSPKAAVAALKAGIEAGANHIDTAEMYGDGEAERLVAEAIKGVRNKVHVVSKVLPSNADYDATIAACERSLERLQTDYLDIYLLHWRNKRTPLAETFRAFEQLKKDGKIRNWGVSNFDVNDLKEALALVGEGKIVCNQVLYHVEERTVEADVLPFCRMHDITVFAYSPLGQGTLPKHKDLSAIARAHKASEAQAALAFLIHNPGVIAIPKSVDKQRAVENIEAAKLRLSEDDLHKIDAAFPLRAKRNLPTA